MRARDEKLQKIVDWAKENSDIRGVLLASSLANPFA
ncbi:MAG: aminoglycoside 6-adenylyltransferase [Mangrovibacterium sp.]